MKLSKSQQDELERLYYFGGTVKNDLEQVTDKDIEDYFNYSERGIKPEEPYTCGYNGLCEAKRMQGIHVHELYEPGILDGTMPYAVFIPGMPSVVVNFLKREMFKGVDAHIIESVYKTCNTY